MKKLKILKLVSILTVLFLVSCEKASETLVNIPSVSVDCPSSSSAVCSTVNTGKLVRVIMTRSGCSNFAFEPVATGSANLSCGTTGCTALLNQWSDANQNSVSEILTGSMSLCGLIDLNSDFNENAGEMEHSSDVSIQSSSQILIDDWTQI